MDEEFMNPDEMSAEETETSGSGDEQQNNTQNASEGVNTPDNGPAKRDPNERVRQVLAEKKALEAELAKYKQADKPSSSVQRTPDDKLRRIELEMKAPAHLEEKVDEMTEFWKKNPNLSKAQVYKIFDDSLIPKSQLDDYASKESEANSSRTGGTANPATRSETPDLSKMKDEELEQAFNQRVQAGDTF